MNRRTLRSAWPTIAVFLLFTVTSVVTFGATTWPVAGSCWTYGPGATFTVGGHTYVCNPVTHPENITACENKCIGCCDYNTSGQDDVDCRDCCQHYNSGGMENPHCGITSNPSTGGSE